MKPTSFVDGLVNVLSALTNRRNATASNIVSHRKLDDATIRAIYLSGIGSKIARIKSSYALNDTLQFKSEGEEKYYNDRLAADVLKAARYMIGFGRGIIVVYQKGDDLASPYRPDDARPRLQRVFSGDLVTVTQSSTDFMDDRYYKPEIYNVRGVPIHWSRVVDFTYFEPPEQEAPSYKYGGLSEYELIYTQLINDGVIERASGSIVEKNSTVFYKVKGFRDALALGKDKDIIKYFSMLEDNRSIYGAGIVDGDDEPISLSQNLTNLSDVNDISLRRLAMVTGIPVAWLIGENVQGLNSTGDNERQIFQDMIEGIEYEYLLAPINRLLKMHDLPCAEFKNNQGDTPTGRIGYEKTVIENAKMLWEMGENHHDYLVDHDIIKVDTVAEFFGENDDDKPAPVPAPEQTVEGGAPDETQTDILGQPTV